MHEDEESAPQDTAARLETAARLLSLLYALISLLFLVWMLIPEHRKRLAAMKAAKTAERLAWRIASRSEHQEMGLELSGHDASYQVPYLASRAALRAARAYEKLRYSA